MATRMQQRRGTAAQWISTNGGDGPVLNAGEIGFESDTNKFKIGDGVNHWVDLNYFTDAEGALAEVTALIDGAPAALNTLNELAAAINDDPAFFTTIATNLSNHEADTTSVHGIADTAALATKTYSDTAVSTAVGALTKSSVGLANVDNTSDANKPVSTATQTALDLKAPKANPTFTGTVVLPAVTAGGSIVPSTDNTYDLGSPTQMWKDIYVGPGSLYVNGQKVLQDESGAIVVSADINENLGLRTSGSGNIEFDPTGTGSINIKGPVVVEADANFSSSDGNGIAFSNGLKSDSVISRSSNTDLSLSGNGTGKVYINDNAEVNGNLVVGGNLTISGTTTTVNSETISLADNIIDLNSNFTTGAPTENAGIRIARGDEANTQLRWNESSDVWQFTNDGSTYDNIVGANSTQTLTNKTLTSPAITTPTGITKSDVGLANVDNTTDLNKPISTAVQADLNLKANLADPTFTGTVAGITKSMVGLGNVDNTADNDKPISSAAQTALNLKAPLAGPVFTGTTTTDNLVVDGDLTVNGNSFTASATSITIEDNMLQLAHENAANTVDLGLVVSYNYTGSAGMHAGIVRDVSENTWKLFKNVEAEPSTTVDFANGELDNLTLGALNAASATIGGVSDTEIQYLNGVTSAIQDQLDAKLASATAASTYAPLASPAFTGTVSGISKSMVGLGNVDNSADLDKPVSTATQTKLDEKAPTANPTFTGTVAGITKSMVGLGNVDNTADASKPVSDATQTALNLKANLDGPTLTGIVTLPSSTSIGDVTSTEIGYLEGVTSAIQNQLDDRPTEDELTKSMVGLANVDNTADLSKPISTDTQAALDLKAPLANPAFTGTVSGVTKSMVGLANVDNTADADKPISTATQTALDAKYDTATATSALAAKAPLESPTFTGTVSGVTKTHVGLGNVDNTSDANKPVSTAQASAIATAKSEAIADATAQVNAVIASAPAALNTLDELAAALGDDANFASTVTTNLAAKAPLASPTFTGTVTVAASGVAFTDGTQTKAGVPSLTTTTTTISGAYNLSTGGLTLRDQLVQISGAHAVTIPTNATTAFPVGTSISFWQSSGAGGASFVGAVGVTVYAAPGAILRALYSSATLTKVTTDAWLLSGDLKA